MNEKTAMILHFHIRGLAVNDESRLRLERSLDQLRSLVSISATVVVLERQRAGTPAFRAFVSLAVPGPDIHAEACDHTLEAAWLKVINALRRKIVHRKSWQDARVKRNGHRRGSPFRGARIPSLARG
jgi:ribosome-associated translation inhibitor RaiA